MLLKVQSMGVHKAMESLMKAGFLYRHLEGVNRGPLAIGDHRGLPDTIQGGASAGSETSRSQVLERTGSASEKRGRLPSSEGRNPTSDAQL